MPVTSPEQQHPHCLVCGTPLEFGDHTKCQKEGIRAALMSGRTDTAIDIRKAFPVPAEFLASDEVQTAARDRIFDALVSGRTETALAIKDAFEVPAESMQVLAKEALLDTLRIGLSDIAIDIKKAFPLPAEFLASDEVQTAARDRIFSAFMDGRTDTAFAIKDAFEVSAESMQVLARRGMSAALKNGRTETALAIMDAFEVPAESMQVLAREALLVALKNSWVDTAIDIKKNIPVSAEFLASDEVQTAAKEGILAALKEGWVGAALAIKDAFEVPAESVQVVVGEVLLDALMKGRVEMAINIKKNIPVPAEFLASDEVQTAAKEGILDAFKKGRIDTAFAIKDAFEVPAESVQVLAKEAMIVALKDVQADTAIKIMKAFPVPAEFLASDEVQTAAKEGILAAFKNDWVYSANTIKDTFQVSAESVQVLARKGILDALRQGRDDTAINIKKAFPVPAEFLASDEVQTVAKEGILAALKNGWVDAALAIKDTFEVPAEFLASDEVHTTLEEFLQSSGSEKDYPLVARLVEYFSVLQKLRFSEMARPLFEGVESYYVETLQFDKLDQFLQITKRTAPIVKEQARKELLTLQKKGLPLTTKQAFDSITRHGVDLSDESALHERIEAAAQAEEKRRQNREDRLIVEKRQIPREAHRLTLLFYVTSRLDQNVGIVTRLSKEKNMDLPFRVALELREFTQDLRAYEDAVAQRLRHYLLFAVHSELEKHQVQLKSRSADVFMPALEHANTDSAIPSVEEFYRFATDEETILYFERAAWRFGQSGWQHSFGGPRWAQIAQAGADLIRDPNPVTIDHIFDLEHNTQAIFDKQDDLITQDTSKLRAVREKTQDILNKKAHITGNTRDLLNGLGSVLSQKDQDEFLKSMHKLVDRWDDLRTKLTDQWKARGLDATTIERYA